MGKVYKDSLSFLLDGEAYSVTDGRCVDLKPSKTLKLVWAAWERAVHKALLHWASGSRAHFKSSIERVLAAQDYAAYDVYMTLAGEGVGIWDGRWDDYFPPNVSRGGGIPKDLQPALKKLLSTAFRNMEQAIQNEVYNQCDSN